MDFQSKKGSNAALYDPNVKQLLDKPPKAGGRGNSQNTSILSRAKDENIDFELRQDDSIYPNSRPESPLKLNKNSQEIKNKKSSRKKKSKLKKQNHESDSSEQDIFSNNTSATPMMKGKADKMGVIVQEDAFRIKKGAERDRIGIFNRLNVDKEQFMSYGLKMQDDMVKKRLANELKPEQIKSNIDKVDKAFASLLTANQLVAAVDYGDGFYVNEPQIVRGDKGSMFELANDRRRNQPDVIKPENMLQNRMQRGVRNVLARHGIIDVSQTKKSKISFFSIQNAEVKRRHDIKAIQEVKELQKFQELKDLERRRLDDEQQHLINEGFNNNFMNVSQSMQVQNLSMQQTLASPNQQNNKSRFGGRPPLPANMTTSLIQPTANYGMRSNNLNLSINNGINNLNKFTGTQTQQFQTTNQSFISNQNADNNLLNNSQMSAGMQSLHKKSSSAGHLPPVQRSQYNTAMEADQMSHFNTQSLSHLRASQIKIQLKKIDPKSVTNNFQNSMVSNNNQMQMGTTNFQSQEFNNNNNNSSTRKNDEQNAKSRRMLNEGSGNKSANKSGINQTSKLDPLGPKDPNEASVKQTRQFDENVILIKPNIDASDKEIYARNGYRTASKNLVNFLESGNRGKFIENVFKPKHLGDFTSDNQGTIRTIQKGKFKADFNKLQFDVNGVSMQDEVSKSKFMNQSQTPQIVSGKGKPSFFDDQQGNRDLSQSQSRGHSKSKSEFKPRQLAMNTIPEDDNSEDENGRVGKNHDPWMRVDLKNTPESMVQMQNDQNRYYKGGSQGYQNGSGNGYYRSQQNKQNDFNYKEASIWKQTQEKRSKIVMLDKNKRMRKLVKGMDKDVNLDNYEFRKLKMELVYEQSDSENDRRRYGDDSDDSTASRNRKKKKQLQANSRSNTHKHGDEDDDQLSSDASEYENEKEKDRMKKNNAVANYDDLKQDLTSDNLKRGEFLSKHGKIVKPDRTDERRKVEKKDQLNDDDMRYFKEKELMREKIKNSNILREVLKKQVKDKQEQKNFKANDEIEALLIEKYKKEAKKIKIGNKDDQAYYIRRQALIDKVLLKNSKAIKSLAEKKRLWVGEEGQFAKKDLAKWYKVYNQTKLAEMKEIFNKDKDGYDMNDLAS